jgi:hypothetical protein
MPRVSYVILSVSMCTFWFIEVLAHVNSVFKSEHLLIFIFYNEDNCNFILIENKLKSNQDILNFHFYLRNSFLSHIANCWRKKRVYQIIHIIHTKMLIS